MMDQIEEWLKTQAENLARQLLQQLCGSVGLALLLPFGVIIWLRR